MDNTPQAAFCQFSPEKARPSQCQRLHLVRGNQEKGGRDGWQGEGNSGKPKKV